MFNLVRRSTMETSGSRPTPAIDEPTAATPAVKTAAIHDLPAASGSANGAEQRLLTPAVQRVIAWHQQRLGARQDSSSAER